MNGYRSNRDCGCQRCSTGRLMGPSVVITLGLLFLLGEFTRFEFHETWPALLIVIGLIKVIQSSTPAEGHVDCQFGSPTPPPPPSDTSQVPHV